MSYEGVRQMICTNGHKWEVDESILTYGAQSDVVKAHVCTFCKAMAEWQCEVDYTNGYDENDPRTYSGPVENIGFDDDWKVDHYGTRYALKVEKYRPGNNVRWTQVQYDLT